MRNLMTLYVCLLCISVGYLIGSISPANMVAAAHHRDIRDTVNGNAGASNIAMSFGVKYGVLVAFLDILKGFCSVGLAMVLTGFPFAGACVGAGVVFGHILPVWTLGKKGGKGFAAYVGVTLGLDWRLFLILALIGLILVFLTDKIVAATFTFAACCPIGLFLTGQPVSAILPVIFISVCVFVAHRENIKNLIAGTEPGVRSVLRK